jgi:tetratricopeptide (TPR) repeat protein
MNYLALHIDTDFIVGTVCSDENTQSYPIKNGNEEFLWLYFYNDPFQHIVSFGKENQKHCSKGETNYYGNFLELIENKNNTFSIGEYEYPIIELLKYSELIKKLKDAFSQKTHESSEDIPTLLTFSLSINELATFKFVDYIKTQGFNIVSYTIPLSELACFYTLNNKTVHFANGSSVAFVEASNADLHLMQLVLSTDYFLLDGEPETKRGLGIDPRKRALLKYVVNKIGTMGTLSEQEKEAEYKIMEPKTDEWLKRIDLQINNNCPVDVNEALSKMPNAKRRVLLYKDKIEEFTGSDIRLILDTYNDFIKRNVNHEVAAIFLLGNCFQNDIVRKKFEYLIGVDKLFFYANKDIQKILAMYPKIDITRYADKVHRIEAIAKAKEQEKAEKRAIEDKRRKEQEAEKERIAAAQKTEEDRKEAQKLYNIAFEQEKKGKLEDARTNIEKAVSLDKTNKEYKLYLNELNTEIKKLNDRNEVYKSYLSKADTLLAGGDLEKALEEYEAAKRVFDNAEIIQKIIEVERVIKNKDKQKAKITQLVFETKRLLQEKDFQNATSKVNEILSIDKSNAEANTLLSEIDQILKQQEKQFNDFVKSADKFFETANYDEATVAYKQALTIKLHEDYCLQQIEKIADTVKRHRENQEQCKKITVDADKLFEREHWIEAKIQYETALNLCPQDKKIQNKIKQCENKIKELDDKFKELDFEAMIAEKKGNLSDALALLEEALKIKSNDINIKSRIKKLKFDMEFDDGFLKQNTAGTSKSAAVHPKDDTDKDDDFLNLKKKNKNDFFNN